MKKILLLVFVSIFLLSSLLFSVHIIANSKNYYIEYEDEGFLPHIRVEYEDLPTKNMNVNLDEIDRINYECNLEQYHQVMVFDNAEKNYIDYTFNGEYEIQDKTLYIKDEIPINRDYDNSINIYLEKDIPDFSKRVYSFYSVNELNENLNMIVSNLENIQTLFTFNIDNFLDNNKLYYVNNNIYVENGEWVGIIYKDSIGIQNVVPEIDIYNDNKNYEYEKKENSIVIKNLNNGKNWVIDRSGDE